MGLKKPIQMDSLSDQACEMEKVKKRQELQVSNTVKLCLMTGYILKTSLGDSIVVGACDVHSHNPRRCSDYCDSAELLPGGQRGRLAHPASTTST